MVRDLLREFIRENLGAMFGLDRHVTMNAFADTISGPSPIDAWVHAQREHEPVTSYELVRSMEPAIPSADDHLNPEDEHDDFEEPVTDNP